MKLEVFDREKHSSLKYHQINNESGIAKMPFVKVVYSEAAKLSNKLCLVFTTDEKPMLVALLGRTKNIMINKDYEGIVPISLLNYPFTLEIVKDQILLCIDTEAEQFKGDGEKLLKSNLQNTKFMDNIENVFKNYATLLNTTINIGAMLKEHDLLINKQITVDDYGEKKALLGGFCVVDEEKLNKLSDKVLAEFARKGILKFIYFHLNSLDNIQSLVNNIKKYDDFE